MAVLLSIQPKWCEQIINGKKTVEIRKTKPKSKVPFKCYIYCTKGNDVLAVSRENNKTAFVWNKKDVDSYNKDMIFNGMVVGEFTCDNVEDYSLWEHDYPALLRHINLYAGTEGDYRFLDSYLKGEKSCYGIHISNLIVYDKPKDLSELHIKDKEAIKKCKNRTRIYNNPDYTNGALLLGSYYCKRKNDWCRECKTKNLNKPPQSWCYVED